MPKRKVLKAQYAIDLVRNIFEAEGWSLSESDHVSRCREFYDITFDENKNLYFATPKDLK